jgi:hypothetical protein
MEIKVDEKISYLIGIIQTDGHLRKSIKRGKGSVSIELSHKDQDIIHELVKLIPYNYAITDRTRDSNFKKDFHSIGLRVCNKEFCQQMNDWGVPCGRKSEIIAPPLHLETLSKIDYVRGLWDGDGSLGFAKGDGRPFVSFTTASEAMKDFIISFMAEITGKTIKRPTRNTRDNIYNLLLYSEDAATFCNLIYYENCLAIKRKYDTAQQIKNWVRSPDSKRVTWIKKGWTKEEDEYIVSHTVEESMKQLDRTKKSVKIRLWRLKGKENECKQELSGN